MKVLSCACNESHHYVSACQASMLECGTQSAGFNAQRRKLLALALLRSGERRAASSEVIFLY